jgi:methyl-accepting chemotaxis protein
MALMTVNAKELRNYPFRRKFDKTFQKLIVMAGVAVLALAITVISAILGLRTIYNKYYQQERIQGEIRIDIQALSKAYLWALSSPDETIRTEQLGKAADKYPDFESNLSEFEKIYSGKEDLSKIRNDLASLQAIGDKISGMFADGSTSEDIFYYFNDQVYPAIDIVATDFKAVSKETTDNVAKVYKTNLIIVSVALLITIFLVILILFYILDMKKKLSAAVAEPADELKAAAAKLAEGNLDIQIVYNAKDDWESWRRIWSAPRPRQHRSSVIFPIRLPALPGVISRMEVRTRSIIREIMYRSVRRLPILRILFPKHCVM